MNTGRIHRVVIVGGGFAGLRTAKSLRSPAVQVTLLDRRNHHVFQPLLYQVATGMLSPANIATPLRSVFRRQRNVEVLLEEVVAFDLAGKAVRCRGRDFPYDTLVVAAGVRHHYFGHDDWEADAPGLKSLEDATALRRRILFAFEAAELEADDPTRAAAEAWLTFVVVGAGPTGIEMAGCAICELARSRSWPVSSEESPRPGRGSSSSRGETASFRPSPSGSRVRPWMRSRGEALWSVPVASSRTCARARSHSVAARRPKRSPPARWSGPPV